MRSSTILTTVLLLSIPLMLLADPYYKIPGLVLYFDAGNYDHQFDLCASDADPIFRAYNSASPPGGYSFTWYKIDFGTPEPPPVNCIHNIDPAYIFAYGNSLTVSTSGIYRCLVNTGSSSYYTDWIYVYIHANQAITINTNTPTAAQDICPGDPVTLSVSAIDDRVNCQNRVKYQWEVRRGGSWSDVSGETSSSITFYETYDQAQYRCELRTGCSNRDTYTNTTPINLPPTLSVTNPPSSRTICEDASTTFSVIASGGEGSPTYKWQSGTSSNPATHTPINDNTDYDNTTTSSLTVHGNYDLNGRYYSCLVTDQCSTQVRSGAGRLYVNQLPNITSHPSVDPKCEGAVCTLSVSATSNLPLTYQWYHGSSPNSPENGTSSIILENLDPDEDAGTYYCRVSNSCAAFNSNSTTLTITPRPVVTGTPIAKDACEGSVVQFTSSYTGPTTYISWQVKSGSSSYSNISNNSTYSGAKTTTLNVTTNTGLNNNLYRFYVANSGCTFEDESDGAILTVKDQLDNISISPSGTHSVCDGSGFDLGLSYSGSPPISIQWQKYTSTWTDISGENGTTYSGTASLSDNNTRYQAVLHQSNICNRTLESDEVTLSVDALPVITDQPESEVKCQGESASFTITGSAEEAVFQWQEDDGDGFTDITNGGKYSGAGTASLTISDLTAAMNGNYYRCLLSGKCSPPQTSDYAILTVNTPPAVDSISSSLTKCVGQSADIIAYVKGTEPLEYKWFQDGSAITGWTDLDTFALASVGSADAGQYKYQVKNICEDVGIYSDEMELTINTPPSFTKHPMSQEVCEGSGTNIVFSATVSGGSQLQWQYHREGAADWLDLVNDTVYSGVTTDELTVSDPLRILDKYQYRCLAVGSCDPPVSSTPALLLVNTVPDILLHPVSDTACVGMSAGFSIEATGSAPLEYKWKKGGKGVSDWLPYDSIGFDEVTLDDDGEAIVC